MPVNQARNAKLIKELVDKDNRNAHYTCVIVAVRDENDPEPLIAIDFWNGTIGYEPKGEGGFGYDPFFIVTPDGKTAAQMTAEEKNAVSHRGKAMRKMRSLLTERWNW